MQEFTTIAYWLQNNMKVSKQRQTDLIN